MRDFPATSKTHTLCVVAKSRIALIQDMTELKPTYNVNTGTQLELVTETSQLADEDPVVLIKSYGVLMDNKTLTIYNAYGKHSGIAYKDIHSIAYDNKRLLLYIVKGRAPTVIEFPTKAFAEAIGRQIVAFRTYLKEN